MDFGTRWVKNCIAVEEAIGERYSTKKFIEFFCAKWSKMANFEPDFP